MVHHVHYPSEEELPGFPSSIAFQELLEGDSFIALGF